MRAMFTAVVGLTVCFTLFGCDQNPQQAQSVAAAPVAIAPPAPCNCRQAAVATTVRVARHHGYRHTYRHHGHTLSEFLAYSTSTSAYGGNVSTSVREYHPGDGDMQSNYSEARFGGAQYEQGASAKTWVDGYGKAHYADYGPADDEHPGLISRRDEHERQKVWRGYNSKCNNRID